MLEKETQFMIPDVNPKIFERNIHRAAIEKHMRN